MKKNVIAALGCVMISSAAFAQNGWLNQVTLPAGNMCDQSPWQLVFSDDFNGTTLNPAWNTYLSWEGIYVVRGNDTVQPYPSHQFWSESRTDPGPSILKDDNVRIYNGTVKLDMCADPHTSVSYHDSTKQGNPLITLNADYSSAILTLPPLTANWQNGTFNSGKFEARIKFPNFNGAWCAFWLWQGTSVNELDMAESWGGDASIQTLYQNKRHTNYAVHAWAPNPNPQSLPGECNITQHYPHQSTWDYMTGQYFHQENWHTYDYEWDTASVKVILDGNVIDNLWKYSRNAFHIYHNVVGGVTLPIAYSITVGSDCSTLGGTWDVTYGYPYNEFSKSGLRLETKWASHPDYIGISGLTSKAILGSMEVDYVRAWQRHPEQEGRTGLCDPSTYPPTPVISGPTEVCGAVNYTLSPATPNGYWDASADIALANQTSSGVSAAKQAGGLFNLGYVKYMYGNGNDQCPLASVAIGGLYCNHGTPWEVVQLNSYTIDGNASIRFITDQYFKRDVIGKTTPTVQWTVKVTPGQDAYNVRTAQVYTLYGEYAATPTIALPKGTPYDVQWTMKAYLGPDTIIRTGERTSKSPTFQQPSDPHSWYLNALVDDQDAYDAAVTAETPKHMVSEAEFNDEIFMSEKIERIKTDALVPYLILDGSDKTMSKTVSNGQAFEAETKVYPNPVQSSINIIAGTKFVDLQPIQMNIYNTVGKLVKSASLDYQKGNFMQADVNELAEGNYILELNQLGITEHIKITKVKN